MTLKNFDQTVFSLNPTILTELAPF